MIDSLGKELLGECKARTRGSRAMVRMDSRPLEIGDFPTTNELVRDTDFFYILRFRPTNACGLQDKPFLLKADVLKGGKIRFKNGIQLYTIRQHNPALAWIMKWTNLSKELLHIAMNNYMTDIILRFDTIAYTKHILSQLPEGTPDYYGVFMEYSENIVEMQKKEAYWALKADLKKKEQELYDNQRMVENKTVRKERNSEKRNG